METTNFSLHAKGRYKPLKVTPDQKTINTVLASTKKRWIINNAIIIARYDWLKRHKLIFPDNMELPNLYMKIKNGKIIHTFYTNVLTHVIKKQNYKIQILN
jgi:hypothetical protein